MSNKDELIKKRREIGDEMKKMTANIDASKWTEEQNDAFQAKSDEYDKTDQAIAAIEKSEAAQAKLDDFEPVNRPNVEQVNEGEPMSEGEKILASPEYNAAFATLVQSKGKVVSPVITNLHQDKTIMSSLSVGTDSEGGYLVPTEWERQMDKLLFDNNVMRQLCTVRQYLNDRNIPLVASVGAAAIIAEGGAYPTNDAAFGNVSLTSFKLGNIQLVTEEMLNDTPQNLAQDIWEMYSESFGGSEEDYFTTGTGSGQPQGSNVGATVGETAASATAVTYDELVNLFSSLAEKYARNGTAMCNRLTAAVIRKLKDSNGQPIWQPRMTEANPEMILGSPLRINESMPAMTTGLKPISFGDMSYHVIADRERLTMQVLNELYAGNGRTGLKFRKRIDSRLKRSDAIKVLEMA